MAELKEVTGTPDESKKQKSGIATTTVTVLKYAQ